MSKFNVADIQNIDRVRDPCQNAGLYAKNV